MIGLKGFFLGGLCGLSTKKSSRQKRVACRTLMINAVLVLARIPCYKQSKDPRLSFAISLSSNNPANTLSKTVCPWLHSPKEHHTPINQQGN